MRRSKYVNEFNVGDGISLYGYRGTVIDVYHWTDNGKKGTYVKVAFDDPANVGYQYEGGNYGGLDNVVSYGYFKR